jgi:acid phosphatase family membrane protein YuiD
MNPLAVFHNPVLWSALIAWALAQGLKLPFEYMRIREWNWAIMFSPGGMPSSHTALVVAAAHAIGLYAGFDTALFGVAVVICMIVIYDATGIRRQAGIQARKINILVNELLSGHAISEKELRDVLGHTPLEALGGFILGFAVTQLLWFAWR